MRPRMTAARAALLALLLVVPPLAVRSEEATAAVDEIDDPWAEADQRIAEPGFGVRLDGSDGGGSKPAQPKPRPISLKQLVNEAWQNATFAKLKLEAGLVAFLLLYIVTIAVGRSQNRAIARAFATAFCLPGGLLDRNFARVGQGEGAVRPPLSRESGNQFRVYATGRRNCRALEAALVLVPRQDLFGRLLGLVLPFEDRLDVELFLPEGAMPQLVLAVATRRVMRQMLREDGGEDDVRRLTRKLEPSRERAPWWPAGQLAVQAEHSSLFYEALPEPLLEQIFGRAAWEVHGRYFRQLHITSEQAYGSKDQKAVVRLSLALPPADRIEEVARLFSSVLAIADSLAGVKLSPEQRKRGEKLRQEAGKAAAKDREKERQEAAEERRLAKRAEEAERVRRMTPEQREKYEQRKAKIETGRQQRKYVRKG